MATKADTLPQSTEAQKKLVKMVVLCRNSMGEPEFHTCAVEVTQAQYDDGAHYELAEENAEDNGYEPKFSFAEDDPAAKQMGDIWTWL